jgi:transcriptional regulator with GAF, ATPase, and Fis domain
VKVCSCRLLAGASQRLNSSARVPAAVERPCKAPATGGADPPTAALLTQWLPVATSALEPVITATPLEPRVALAELGQLMLDETDLQAALGRVAELARQTLPAAAAASVTLVSASRAYTVAFAGQLASDLDETQYQEGYGPCLEIAQSSGTVIVADMAAETRWPTFAAQALGAGVRASLSVALPLQEAVLGALNIYATEPGVFDEDAVELARTFAGYAAVAIANVHLYEVTATLAENMRRAMETRAVIEQAKGIIVAQQHCTPERAFELLTRLSQTTHRKLRDCAADLVSRTANGSA